MSKKLDGVGVNYLWEKINTKFALKDDIPQSVVIKASYLLFPSVGEDGVLYVDKSDKEIYIYDTDTASYEVITQNLTPMTDDEVAEMTKTIIKE